MVEISTRLPRRMISRDPSAMRLARVDSDTFSTAMASALATRVGPLGPISTPPAGIAACHTNFEVRTGALKTLCIPAPGQSTRQGTAAPSRQDAGPSRDAGVPNRSRPGPQDPIPHRDAVPGRCAPLARARRLTCVAPCDLRGGTEERGEVGLGVSARFPRGTKEVQLGPKFSPMIGMSRFRSPGASTRQ